MTPPIRWAARLYPARWRERYGAEFSALLDDMRPGWRDFFDVLGGAILMQLNLPGSGKLVAALAAAGLIVAAVVALRSEDRWVSTAVMQIQPENSGDRSTVLNKLNEAQQEVLSRHSLAQIIVAENIYQKERTTDPLEDIVQNMRNHSLKIRMVESRAAAAFTVSFEYPDRYKARAVARDVTTAFQQQVNQSRGPAVKLLDPPTLPQTPVSPNRFRMIAAGLAIGLAAGVILLGIRRWPAIALCGITAAGLAWAVSQLVPTQYISTAVITVADEDTAQRIVQDLTTRTYLASLVEKMNLYPEERKTKPLEDIVQTMRNRVGIQFVGIPQGRALAVSYMSEDSKFTAQGVTRALVGEALQVAAPALTGKRITLLDPASLPEHPVSPDRPAWLLSGLLAGLLLGIAWTIIRRFRAPAQAHA
ncbi:MAG TPA: hypothetical protein VKB88_22710 [Bryobacteraceae bacterium]|nr:hypothetical protein [Bryobacteraceae bacterium]